MTHLFIGTNEEAIRENIEEKALSFIPSAKNMFSKEVLVPDIHILSSIDNESIGIKEMTSFIYELSKKPFRESHQLGIILNLDEATIQAQNKILKELEDHTDATVYLIGVQNENNILSTIKSRATVTYVETELSVTDAKEIQGLAKDIISPQKDILDIYTSISNEKWTKIMAEELLSQIYSEIAKRPSLNKNILTLFAQTGEYLKSNVSPKHVVLFFLFAFRNEI